MSSINTTQICYDMSRKPNLLSPLKVLWHFSTQAATPEILSWLKITDL